MTWHEIISRHVECWDLHQSTGIRINMATTVFRHRVDVHWTWACPISAATLQFFQKLIQANSKGTRRALHYGSRVLQNLPVTDRISVPRANTVKSWSMNWCHRTLPDTNVKDVYSKWQEKETNRICFVVKLSVRTFVVILLPGNGPYIQFILRTGTWVQRATHTRICKILTTIPYQTRDFWSSLGETRHLCSDVNHSNWNTM